MGFTAVTGEVAVVDDIAAADAVQAAAAAGGTRRGRRHDGGDSDARPAVWRAGGFSTRKTRVFTPDEVQFLLTAANTIGMAAERRRAEAAMQKLAAFVKENPNPALELSADGAITYFKRRRRDSWPSASASAPVRNAAGRTSAKLPPAACIPAGPRQPGNPNRRPHHFLVASSPCCRAKWCIATAKTSPARLNLEKAASAVAKNGIHRPARGGRGA